jgi:hypothetical protein
MISVEEAFELVNNMDHRLPLRRFAPQWAIVVVNSKLEIVGVHRFKTKPTVEQANATTDTYRGCIYFYTNPDMYVALDAFKKRIEKCAESFRSLSGSNKTP